MRSGGWRLAAFALFAFGCTHTKTTDAESNVPSKSKEEKRDEPTAKDREAGGKEHGAADRERRRNPADVPVASAPSGLLKPGAEEKIRDKLGADGEKAGRAGGESAGSMGAALKKFPAAHDLPATGKPDMETVRKLGLNPDDIFVKAERTQGRE